MMNKFDSFVSQLDSKIKIKYKNESLFMKLIGLILFFNKDFMTGYTTTIGNTIYFSSRDKIEKDPEDAIIIAAHEWQHMLDSRNLNPILYSCLYLTPQLFALLGIFAAFYIGLWALLFAIFLLPIPSYLRMVFERRGYEMTLFMCNEVMLRRGVNENGRIEKLTELAGNIDKKQFRSGAYYFMWPFGLKSYFDKAIKNIISGAILERGRYRHVKDVYNSLS